MFAKGPHKFGTAEDWFYEKVVAGPDCCWIWIGGRTKEYGAFQNQLAHRWSYAHHVGPIPDGYQVDHLCFNTLCVYPLHLEAVTQAENRRRQTLRGASRPCVNGHGLEHFYVRKSGKRVCRLCAHDSARRVRVRNSVGKVYQRKPKELS